MTHEDEERPRVEVLLPPVEDTSNKARRTLTVEPEADTATSIDLSASDEAAAIAPIVPELPSLPIARFPNLFARVSEALYARSPDGLSDDERDELDWAVANVVLATPSVTLLTDRREASEAYTITSLALDQEGVIWDGKAIVDHGSVWKEAGRPRRQPVYWNVRHGRGYRDGDPSRANLSWDRWYLPRLQTERSLRAQRDGTGNPRLHAPGVSWSFFWAYTWAFLFNAAYRDTAHRFLGSDLMPGGLYALAFANPDHSASLDELIEREAFQERRCTSMRHPEIAESDAWLVDRILNGMHPCLFRAQTAEHRGVTERQLVVAFEWNHLTFGPLDWSRRTRADDDPEEQARHYELPNASAALAEVDGELVLRRITLQHRKSIAPGAEPIPGPVTDADLEPPEVYLPPSEGGGERAWSYAKRAFRCQLAMAGELDVHLGGAHLLVEQIVARVPVDATVEPPVPELGFAMPSSALPDAFDRLDYDEKLERLWQRCEEGIYTPKPSSALTLFRAPVATSRSRLREGLADVPATAFQRPYDLTQPRRKVVHQHGAVARVRFEPDDSPYTGLLGQTARGLLRCSSSLYTRRYFIPGIALKLPISGQHSRNLVGLVTLQGQGRDHRFFLGEMTTDVPPIRRAPNTNWFWATMLYVAQKRIEKQSQRILREAARRERSGWLPLEPFAEVTQDGQRIDVVVAPARLRFVPTPDVQQQWRDDERHFYDKLTDIHDGTTLYTVVAESDAHGVTAIGRLVLERRFIVSRIADEQLHFGHLFPTPSR